MSSSDFLIPGPQRQEKLDKAAPYIISGAGLLGLKADRDLGKLTDGMKTWYDELASIPQRGKGTAVRDAFNSGEVYAKGARKLLSGKVLGMPLPYWAMQTYTNAQHGMDQGFLNMIAGNELRPSAKSVWDSLQKNEKFKGSELLRKYLGKNEKRWGKLYNLAHDPGDAAYHYGNRKKHYAKYFNKLDDIGLAQYATFDNMDGYAESTRSSLGRIGRDKTFKATMRDIRRTNPGDYDTLKGVIRSRANMISGAGAAGGGMGHKYYHEIMTYLPKFRTGLRNVSIPLAAGGATIAAVKALRGDNNSSGDISSMMNSNQFIKRSNTQEELAYGAAGAGAAGLGAKSYQTLRRPMDVGFTYSDLVEKHGAGHRNPGRALRKIVDEIGQENPHLKLKTHAPTIGQFGLHSDPSLYNKKYDHFFDTGMGINSPYRNDNAHLAQKGMPGHMQIDGIGKRHLPKVRPGGYVGYLTDLGSEGTPMKGYQATMDTAGRRIANRLSGQKDKYISWGPQNDKPFWLSEDPVKARKIQNQFEFIRPSAAAGPGFPMMDPSASDIIKRVGAEDRGKLFKEMIAEKDFLDPGQKKHVSQLAKGKKELLMVTGSARGDNVASRMHQLQKAIEKRGLQDRYTVGGVLGENYNHNPMSKAVAEDPRMLSFKGRIPQKWYVGIPAMAERTWGSTGTSAGMETMATPTPASFMEHANKWRDKEIRYLRRFGAGLEKLHGGDYKESLNKLHPWALDLDHWNRGNKKFYFDQGARKAQTADDFLNQAISQTSTEKRMAKQKANKFLEQSGVARQDLKDSLRGMFHNTHKRTLRRGGALGLGAAALASAPFIHNATKGTAAAPVAAPYAFQGKEDSLLNYPSKRGINPNVAAALAGGGAAALLGVYIMNRRRKNKKDKTND